MKHNFKRKVANKKQSHALNRDFPGYSALRLRATCGLQVNKEASMLGRLVASPERLYSVRVTHGLGPQAGAGVTIIRDIPR